MSFRNRLNLFFVCIVVVPIVAVTAMVASLLDDNVDGKRQARLAGRHATVLAYVQAQQQRADRVVEAVGRDPEFAAALRAGRRRVLRARVAELLAAEGAKRIVVLRGRRVVADVGVEAAIFPATRDLRERGGRRIARLQVSVVGPREVQQVADGSDDGVEVVIKRGQEVLRATDERYARASLPARSGHSTVAGRDTLAAVVNVPTASFPGGAEKAWLLRRAGVGPTAEDPATSFGLIAGMGAFMLLAFVFALLVSRSLQHEIGTFLHAARRLGRGELTAKVPISGRDEFGRLAREFNEMADQLRARMEDLRTERERLQLALRRIGDAFAANLDRVGVLRVVVETAVDGTAAEAGRAVVRARPGAPLRPVVHHGPDAGDLAEGLRAAEARVLETGEPADVALEAVVALAHPLQPQDPQGDVPGVVSVARHGRAFSDGERDLFAHLSRQAAVSVENVGLHELVERQALTDQLTGLFNRRRFDEGLAAESERFRRFGTAVGLLLLDIDDFKQVNDGHGHPQGDLVLQEVARVLRESCREIDEPARYGGEELAAVLPGTDLVGALNLAERVRAELERLELPLLDGSGTLRITASFGVATMPGSAVDAAGLVAAADEALYRAKRAGKNRVEPAGTTLL